MKENIEKTIDFPHVSVQLVTVSWEGIEETLPYPGYSLSQRLSDNHPPLRIGNLSASSVLPRVHSVGLLPPDQSIRLFPVEAPLRVLLCIFDQDYFEQTTQIAKSQWLAHTEALVSMNNKRLEIMMQEIYAELVQPGFGDELLIEAISTIILVELARYGQQLNRKDTKSTGSLALSPWQLRRIYDRIQAGPELGYPSLAELAEICGISEGHLARAFKASTGWQIHKYITDERFKTAKAMLSQEHYSCEAVSVCLGFKSPAYFSTAFKRVTGKSPSEFRRQKFSKNGKNS